MAQWSVGEVVTADKMNRFTFEPGTRIAAFDQDAAPTGWTRDTTTVNDRVIRVVTGARAPGGSWTISGLTHSHTHGLGGHTHTVPRDGWGSGATTTIGRLMVDSASQAANDNTSGGPSASSDGASTATVSSDGTWRPLHRDVILCSKDS